MKTFYHLRAVMVVIRAFLVAAFSQTPPAPDVVQFATDLIEVSEVTSNGDSGVFVSFEVKHSPEGGVGAFRVEVSGGTATRDVDYKLRTDGSFRGPSYGQNGGWILDVLDDGIHEVDETIELTLRQPTGNVVFGPRSKTTVIIRNSPSTFMLVPTVSAFPAQQLRERFGGSRYPIAVERHGDRDTAASVRLSVVGGWSRSRLSIFPSTTVGKDIAELDERVDFATGQTIRTIPVGILDDGLVEGPESVTFQLTNPIGGVLHPTKAVVESVIEDNEVAPHLDVTQPPPLQPLQLGRVSLEEPPAPFLVTPLQSGARLIWEEGAVVKRSRTGKRDPSFKLAVPRDFRWDEIERINRILLTEAEDGTLWGASGEVGQNFGEGRLIHFDSNGSVISEKSWSCETFPEGCVEGCLSRLVGILRDGRLLFLFHSSYYRLFRMEAQMVADSSFIPLQAGGIIPGSLVRFDPVEERLITNYSINEPPFQDILLSLRLRLLELPSTALNVSAFWWRKWAGPFPPSPSAATIGTLFNHGASLASETNVYAIFHRLGSSAESATVHFTTRDLTAKAAEDYVARSGTLRFAPLEVEKSIEIAIIPNDRRRFIEEFEIVVTSADGVIELPAPRRVPVYGAALSVVPALDGIRRLADGRVLLGGQGSTESLGFLEYSTDLKSWYPLAGLPSVSNGSSGLWLDASATNAPMRYYRAIVP